MVTPTTLEVHLDTADGPLLAGLAYLSVRRGILTARFDYDTAFLGDPRSFDLSPALRRLEVGSSAHGLPGAFADSAPDRWGRMLIKRRMQAAAREAQTTSPTVTEADYLCGVSDLTRQGALRFRPRGGTAYVAVGTDVPRLIELPALLAATRRVSSSVDDDEAIETLLAAGSASLGGARPKASVRDGDRLAIAKFPHDADEWDLMAWEATMLHLAERCGIRTPRHRVERIGEASVLLLDRFDRDGARRIPYISAMTLLDRTDGQDADYVEIAEALAAHGSRVGDDLRELWRRVAFSIAVNNTDDHLRNHGFLREVGGWRLAPVFDVNPNPDPSAHRVTSVMGATDRSGCLRSLFGAAQSFGLRESEAARMWDEIRAAVSAWRGAAAANGLGVGEQRRFADALDTRIEA